MKAARWENKVTTPIFQKELQTCPIKFSIERGCHKGRTKGIGLE